MISQIAQTFRPAVLLRPPKTMAPGYVWSEGTISSPDCSSLRAGEPVHREAGEEQTPLAFRSCPSTSWRVKHQNGFPAPPSVPSGPQGQLPAGMSLCHTHQEERALGCPVPGAARAVLFAGQNNQGKARLLVPLSGIKHIKLRKRKGRYYRCSKGTECRHGPGRPGGVCRVRGLQ